MFINTRQADDGHSLYCWLNFNLGCRKHSLVSTSIRILFLYIKSIVTTIVIGLLPTRPLGLPNSLYQAKCVSTSSG